MNRMRRMLAVDDVKINRMLIKALFSDEYEIIEATNGVEALERLAFYEGNIDIIIMDILMPIMDGYQTITEIKKHDEYKYIPIIVSTTLNDAENEGKLIDLGVNDIIFKPFDNQIMRRRVQAIEKSVAFENMKIENALLKHQTDAQIQLDAMVNKMTNGISLIEVGVKLKALYFNNAFCKYFSNSFNLSEEDNDLNEHILDVVYLEDQEKVYYACKKAIENNTKIDIEYRILKNNTIYWSRCQGVRIPYRDNKLPVLLCVFTDITKIKETEQDLLDTTVQLSALVNNVPCGYATYRIVNGSMQTVYCNSSLYENYGLNQTLYDKTLGKDFFKYIYADDAELFITEILAAEENRGSIDLTFRTKGYGNKIYWSMIRGQFITIGDEEPLLYALVLDISKEKEYQLELFKKSEEIRYRADHDELTGLYNHIAFNRSTRELLDDNPNEKYTIFRINIEKFRLFNDLFGTNEANGILISISRTLINELDGIGRYARIETDHFVGCIPTKYFNPSLFLSHLQQRINKDHNMYQVIIDMGIYEIDDPNIPISIMCDRAYLALQTIKGKYGDRYTYYDDLLRQKIFEEQEIESEMQEALVTHQFIIYLQPIYSIGKMQPVMAEALVRWKHPTKGIIPPNKFIPIFEKNGFIAKMDYDVWETTCKYIQSRKLRNKPLYPISVNISRMSLYKQDLAENIISLVNKYDIDPSLLHLEITESAYNDNPKRLIDILNRLHEYGFTILMDDFGSGYSSLNALKEIPVDILKMDMKFMENIESGRGSSIIMSVVRMAKWLNFAIVAEGVETVNQVEFLKSVGCDAVQGYYFYKPMPTDLYDNEVAKHFVTDIPFENGFTVDDINHLFTSGTLLSKIMLNTFELIGFYELHHDKLEVIRINNQYYETLGYTPETYFNEKYLLSNHFFPADLEKAINASNKAYQTKEPQRLLLRKYHADGTLMYFDSIFYYITGNDGRILILVTSHNITNEYSNQIKVDSLNKELAQKQDLLMSLCDSIPNSFIVLNEDEDYSIYQLNSVAWKAIGRNKFDYQLEKGDLTIKQIVDEDSFQKIVSLIKEVQKDGNTHVCSFDLNSTEGKKIAVHGKVGFVELSNGNKKILFNLDII